MSTQTRNSGGSRNQKKSNSGGGGGGGDSVSQTSHKKTDNSKTEKEKSHPKVGCQLSPKAKNSKHFYNLSFQYSQQQNSYVLPK